MLEATGHLRRTVGKWIWAEQTVAKSYFLPTIAGALHRSEVKSGIVCNIKFQPGSLFSVLGHQNIQSRESSDGENSIEAGKVLLKCNGGKEHCSGRGTFLPFHMFLYYVGTLQAQNPLSSSYQSYTSSLRHTSSIMKNKSLVELSTFSSGKKLEQVLALTSRGNGGFHNNNSRCHGSVSGAKIDQEFFEKGEQVEGLFGGTSICGTKGNALAFETLPEHQSVHPMAIVHPSAILNEGVVIGPFCTVGPEAKLGRGCKLYPNSHVCGNTELGEGCVLLTGAIVGSEIPGQTVLGCFNSIGHHAVVGVKCQDMKYKEGDECFLFIGSYNDIREHASVHRSSKSSDSTIIGDHNLIMGSCHVAHDCKLGNNNILANGTLLGGHVIVQDFVHTGGAVAVHQFCHIDSFSFIAGGSMVDKDVPMYMMVAGDRAELRGLNLEGMRRRGFSESEVKSIRRAYQKLFMNTNADAGGLEDRLSDLNSDECLSKVPAVRLMLRSVRSCFETNRRGICKFRQWESV